MKTSGDPLQFAARPPQGLRGALVYGPNQSLADEVAASLKRALLPNGADDFSFVVISSDDLKQNPARITEELSSFGFFAAKKVLLVKDAGDGQSRALQEALDAPDAGHFIILQSENLTPKSSLRALAEKSPLIASLPCYEMSGATLARFVQDKFRAADVTLDRDALSILLDKLGTDTSMLNGIIQQLIDYVGGDKPVIRAADVEALLVDQAEQALDDAVQAALDRDLPRFDRVLNSLYESGTSLVAVLRALQQYFYKLRTAQASMKSGASQDEALNKIRPPLFFKIKPLFIKHLRGWNLVMIDRALRELLYLESQCKKTGTPELALVQQRLNMMMLRK
jgi:DNA polymerase-3 subunit delta